MPSTWLVIDSEMPAFSKDVPMKEQVSQLQNYMVILIEQLRFQLSNLNASNWNNTAIKQFQQDTADTVTEEIENAVMTMEEIARTLEDLSGRLGDAEAQLVEAQTDIAWLEKAQEDLQELQELTRTENDELRQRVSELEAAVESSEETVTVGDGVRPVHLVGEIYINGVKIE